MAPQIPVSCIADTADETEEPSGLLLIFAGVHWGKGQYRNTSKEMVELARRDKGVDIVGKPRFGTVLWIAGTIGGCAEGIWQPKQRVGPIVCFCDKYMG